MYWKKDKKAKKEYGGGSKHQRKDEKKAPQFTIMKKGQTLEDVQLEQQERQSTEVAPKYVKKAASLASNEEDISI
jgi:hypothetical protein